MKGTTRCSDHGQAETESFDGRPYWKPSLRSSLSWGSPERTLERLIVKAFVRSGGAEMIEVSLPDSMRTAVLDHAFMGSVKRLVADSLYRIEVTVSGNILKVTAV